MSNLPSIRIHTTGQRSRSPETHLPYTTNGTMSESWDPFLLPF